MAVALYRIPPMTELDFEKLAQQLEETVAKLKVSKNAEERKTLLREMRRLLVETDRINVNRQA
jgi:hypothetical protein